MEPDEDDEKTKTPVKKSPVPRRPRKKRVVSELTSISKLWEDIESNSSTGSLNTHSLFNFQNLPKSFLLFTS